jgi:hypothetical protein
VPVAELADLIPPTNLNVIRAVQLEGYGKSLAAHVNGKAGCLAAPVAEVGLHKVAASRPRWRLRHVDGNVDEG